MLIQNKTIKQGIYGITIIFILTGSIFFAYSATPRPTNTTPYDMIIGEIPEQNLIFLITKLVFGGNMGNNDVGKEDGPGSYSKFAFSYLVIEKDPQLAFTQKLLDLMLEGRDLNFQLIVTVYENCDGGYNQCTVTSKLTLNSAFIAGYNSIYNGDQFHSTLYTAYETYEFGYDSLLLESPNTLENVPDLSFGVSGSQSTTSTATGGVNRAPQDTYLTGYRNWRINFIGDFEFDFSALQFSISAQVQMVTIENRGVIPQVTGYTISDIYMEKQALDIYTTSMVEYIQQEIKFDAEIIIGFCSSTGLCTDKITIELSGTFVTSLLSYLEDPTQSRDSMVQVEIFSIASTGFRILFYP